MRSDPRGAPNGYTGTVAGRVEACLSAPVSDDEREQVRSLMRKPLAFALLVGTAARQLIAPPYYGIVADSDGALTRRSATRFADVLGCVPRPRGTDAKEGECRRPSG